ncbi:hypothetical protein [Massilia consociata]|uniref:Uncharacterized protein n=1 Tax=Massilia consociata TaxID=760117 RepID=A0ABV6FF79_9BURK
MSLPDLSWQFLYGRLAWALVFAAVVVAAWPARRLPRPALAAIVGVSGLLMALPGEASPAWHLGLAFQYPSALLAGLCGAALLARWRGQPVVAMPRALAGLLAAAGLVLYLDAFGLFALGIYYAGFGPSAAPLCALLLAMAAAIALVRGIARPQAAVLLGAVLLFSLARLPSGNLWDALLDPLLWGWAVVSLAAHALRAVRSQAIGPRAVAAPVAAPAVAAHHDQPALHAVGAEPFSPIKE